MFHAIYRHVAAKASVGQTVGCVARGQRKSSEFAAAIREELWAIRDCLNRTAHKWYLAEGGMVMKSAKAFLVWRNTHAERTLTKVPYALMDVAMSELLIDLPSFRS
jgi:hypothetical protein